MRILGLSGYYHDSAAALLCDANLVAAAQEERFSRIKHDPSFPREAARFCLQYAGVTAGALDAIVWYEKPFRKLDRILDGFVNEAPRGLARFLRAVPLWLRRRVWMRREIERELGGGVPVFFIPHHESHAASAYGPSPFAHAAVLTIDGVGEWASNALWEARGPDLRLLAELHYPDSLGLLYSAFTAYCGFAVNDGEYKLMGLAPYGEPAHVQTILDEVIELHADGSYRLCPELFGYRHCDQMTTSAFHRLFGGPPRKRAEPLTRRHADLARSIQAVTEEVILRQARHAKARTGARSLCLAGGVALNCVANGRLAKEGVFESIWIQPASGDAGGALGAAYALFLRLARPERQAAGADGQKGSLLGPEYDEAEMARALQGAGLAFDRLEPDRLVDETARALANGEVVGWFQGRMEYGPRALGNRSILADPRNAAMQSRVNLAVKKREGFRPFAPVVAAHESHRWFQMPASSPYMLLTGTVLGAEPSPLLPLGATIGARGPKAASPLAAVTHVDASARVQTLETGMNPPLERLLARFGELTGSPVLLNTSFNVMDEPIVCTPYDAVACFCGTGIDRLVLGPLVCVTSAKARPALARRSVAPQDAQRSVFSAACEVGLALAAALVLALRHAWRASATIATIAVLLAVSSWLVPGLRRQVRRMLSLAGRTLGAFLGWPVLVLVFVLFVVPAGALRRLGRTARSDGSRWRVPEASTHDPRLPF